MLGSASIISAPTAPDTLERSVCSSGASAVTSTVSPSWLTVSSTGMRTVSVAPTATPVRLNVAKPESETVTVYVPAWRSGAVKRPASVVTNSAVTLVASLVRTTVAPGTTAFCGSVTMPVMVAERIWAKATDEHDRLNRTNSEQSRCLQHY